MTSVQRRLPLEVFRLGSTRPDLLLLKGLKLSHLLLERGLALRDTDCVHPIHGGTHVSAQCGNLEGSRGAQLVLELLVEKLGHGRHIGGQPEILSVTR